MRRSGIEKAGFILSAAVLIFLYGYGTKAFGWFPVGFLDRAVTQAHRQLSPPLYLVPRVYEREGVQVVEPHAVQPGLTLISSRWVGTDWAPQLRLIDSSGETLHEWTVEPSRFQVGRGAHTAAGSVREFENRPLHGTYLYPDGDVLVNLDYEGTVRLDACSRVRWLISTGSHHSIARTEDGSFWIPGSSHDRRSATSSFPDGFPGLEQPVFLDRLLHVSPEGAVLDSFNVLDLLYENDLEYHIFKSKRFDDADISHLNDIEPLSDSLAADFPNFESGDLLVSLRHLDLVMIVDPETRRVRWHASHPFIEQHDPDFMAGGWIGVFDNNRDGTPRGSALGGSRILALTPRSDSVRKLFPTARSEPFHTDIMGKWQQLANGNLLLTEARAGRVVEVAPDGRTVWEWVSRAYDESLVPEVAEATRYPLTADDVATWPCSPNERDADSDGPEEDRP